MVTCQYAGSIAPDALVAPIKLVVQVALPGPQPIQEVRNCAAAQGAGDVDETNNRTCINTRLSLAVKTYLPLVLRQ